MKINYCITVSTEEIEIQNLIDQLLEYKAESDNVIVLMDVGKEDMIESNPRYPTWKVVNLYADQNLITLETTVFDGDFAKFKNKFRDLVDEGDYIFQLDADEMPPEILIRNIHATLESNPTELLWLPRINTVEGLTHEQATAWHWNLDLEGRVNFPDLQGRIYKNLPHIVWEGRVHERIIGNKTQTVFPPEYHMFALLHPKTIDKQTKQNDLYAKIANGDV